MSEERAAPGCCAWCGQTAAPRRWLRLVYDGGRVLVPICAGCGERVERMLAVRYWWLRRRRRETGSEDGERQAWRRYVKRHGMRQVVDFAAACRLRPVGA